MAKKDRAKYFYFIFTIAAQPHVNKFGVLKAEPDQDGYCDIDLAGLMAGLMQENRSMVTITNFVRITQRQHDRLNELLEAMRKPKPAIEVVPPDALAKASAEVKR